MQEQAGGWMWPMEQSSLFPALDILPYQASCLDSPLFSRLKALPHFVLLETRLP